MALLLDPIASGLNSLLAPLTSVPATTDSPDDVQPITSATATSASSIIMVTPSAVSKTSTSSSILAKSTATASTSDKPTSSIHSSSSSTKSPPSTSSSQSSFSTPTHTTLSTSTIPSSTSSTIDSSSSSSTSSISSISSTTSAIPLPSAPPAASANSNTSSTSSSGSNISTAGIVVAIIFTVALIISIIWLTIRFCPPIRNRIDAWAKRRKTERSYREAIDGPAVPVKEFEPYSATSDRSAAREKHFSFFALGRNPRLEQQEVVHHQYISPNSASTPRGDGLGLGRVSLLRNHSLLRKAGHDVPVHIPLSATKTYFASVTAVPASIPAGETNVTKSEEVRRKPLPVPLPVQKRVTGGEQSRQMQGRTRDRNSPLPRLYVDIPNVAGQGEAGRVSQIGLAVTSKSPAPRSGGGYRV